MKFKHRFLEARLVGRIIGVGGTQMRAIERATGTRLEIEDDPVGRPHLALP
jgi:rRNA processing protein Krr1/Pno1